MAKALSREDASDRIIQKLGRIEDLLVNLIALQACAADANRMKVARLLGVDNGRVSKVSSVLKRKRGDQ